MNPEKKLMAPIPAMKSGGICELKKINCCIITFDTLDNPEAMEIIILLFDDRNIIKTISIISP